MTEAHHSDPAAKWLFFFFVCFGIVLLGIVIFFARDVNTQSDAEKPNGGNEKPSAGGAHHSMLLPEQNKAPFFLA